MRWITLVTFSLILAHASELEFLSSTLPVPVTAEKSHLEERGLPKDRRLELKYILNNEVLITPRTHPYLFSFNGRWNRRRDVYKASTWPGTSVTILVYGDSLRIKIKCPQKTGTVTGHYFIASIEGGPQLLLSLPPYDALKNQVFDLEIKLPARDNINGRASIMRTPRVVELISEPYYPISLIGIKIHNVQIKQGRTWLKKQRKIPTVEYISDKLPDTNYLNRTSAYNVARQLGLRQSYVSDHGTCFTNECSPNRPGLADQYSFFDPFFQKSSQNDARLPMPSKHNFNQDDSLVLAPEPQFIVLDVGDNDLYRNVNGAKFRDTLQNFLGQMIVNAHPQAHIFVLIHKGRYVKETEDAILSMQHNHLGKLHAVNHGGDSEKWFKLFYCSYVIPFSDDQSEYQDLCGTAYEKLTTYSFVLYSKSVIKWLSLSIVILSVFGPIILQPRVFISGLRRIKRYRNVDQV